MGHRITSALLISLTSCLLPDVDGLHGSSPSPDASVVDAALDGPADATDAAKDASTDVVGDGGPCSGGLLVGSNDVTIPGTDYIGVGTIDAYGYTAVASGTARCAWIHLEGIGGGLQIGVFKNGASSPGALVAAGFITTPKVGWNAVVLDQAVPINPGDVLWIGLLCGSSPTPLIRAVGACGAGQFKMYSQFTFTLPSPFVGTGPNPECGAPFYLTP